MSTKKAHKPSCNNNNNNSSTEQWNYGNSGHKARTCRLNDCLFMSSQWFAYETLNVIAFCFHDGSSELNPVFLG